MKIELSKISLVAGVALAASVSFASVSSADQGRFASFVSPKNPVVEFGAEPFIERVAEETNGELTYKMFAGGSLLGGKNMVQGLRDGVADIGQIVFGYYPAEFPYASLVADMAIYGEYPPAVAAAVTEFNFLNCTGCLEDYKRNGIVVLGTTSTSAYQLLAAEDMSTVEALKGKKIRTAGALWSRWAVSVGAIPVSAPSSEMYEQMSRGQVEVAIQPTGALKSHSIWDVARKVTKLNLGTYRSWGIFSVSSKHWATLNTDQRTILMKNASIGLIDAALGYMAKDDEVEAVAEEKQVEIIEPSEALKKSVTDFLKTDRATVIELAKTKYKIADPEPLMDKFVELINKWEDLYKPIQGDRDAMSQMLWDEVMSKVDVATLGN
ncbi:C4-dicarboxylate TRAP transporter substrate-binding protein [Sneathiella sp. HT1-7]|jgi:TRAP-type C4-dicarboxylate transport system substrate-binding protein|uniref:C4-dicarboxylate TRAP transporter substrate-binding protein n=1 Tax=Sneathiella sp. HT1-7 TaxID=2887192 RepID=UPI001D14E6DD|nr:C4-dicarboxylate TRAP transporter substrate-binding protein [Sneathiella sp. HT1-7]MCC3306369.1 C4-dicarboxylate TRAP transporter substrate-binding protein [Sneathiella sp. HT1-7]